MPCMGPDYSKEKADAAFAEIVELLKTKYKVLSFPVDCFWMKHRKEAMEKLRQGVHEMFKQDCFEGF